MTAVRGVKTRLNKRLTSPAEADKKTRTTNKLPLIHPRGLIKHTMTCRSKAHWYKVARLTNPTVNGDAISQQEITHTRRTIRLTMTCRSNAHWYKVVRLTNPPVNGGAISQQELIHPRELILHTMTRRSKFHWYQAARLTNLTENGGATSQQVINYTHFPPVSYTHLTLPTIYSV